MADRERIFTGIGVSHGIAIAPAYLVELERPQIPERKIDPSGVAAEQQRFEGAVARVRAELTELKSKLEDKPETAAEEVTLLLDAPDFAGRGQHNFTAARACLPGRRAG